MAKLLISVISAVLISGIAGASLEFEKSLWEITTVAPRPTRPPPPPPHIFTSLAEWIADFEGRFEKVIAGNVERHQDDGVTKVAKRKANQEISAIRGVLRNKQNLINQNNQKSVDTLVALEARLSVAGRLVFGVFWNETPCGPAFVLTACGDHDRANADRE